MSHRRIERAGLLATALLVFAAQPAAAQLGKLKKAAQQAASNATASVAGTSVAVKPDANLVPITDAVVGDVMAIAGLDEDIRQLEMQRVDIQAADRQHHDAWNACVEQVKEGHMGAAQALQSRAQAAQQAGDLKRVMAIADTLTQLQQKIIAGVGPRCGSEPARDTYSPQHDALLQQRMGALTDAGLSDVQLAIVKERIVPFCRLAAQGQADAATQQVPGDTRGKFYVYTQDEAAAIAPRCGVLMPLLIS